MTTREANLTKKWYVCLGCGRRIWTDRSHRFCKTCRRQDD